MQDGFVQETKTLNHFQPLTTVLMSDIGAKSPRTRERTGQTSSQLVPSMVQRNWSVLEADAVCHPPLGLHQLLPLTQWDVGTSSPNKG